MRRIAFNTSGGLGLWLVPPALAGSNHRRTRTHTGPAWWRPPQQKRRSAMGLLLPRTGYGTGRHRAGAVAGEPVAAGRTRT